MLAELLRFPAEAGVLQRGEWVYERKWDGLRCIAVKDGARVDLWSRNRLSFNHRFPALASALARLPVDTFVLDGEVVAFSGDRTSFQLLQTGSSEPALVAFDLTYLLGRETTVLPLVSRAELLHQTFATAPSESQSPSLRLSERLEGTPADLLATACGRKWEGLVAKKAGSPYRPGRSPDWRKIKCSARQELVIGGWTDPGGARTGFGALLVGYYDGDRLAYAGKVGTGFDERTLRSLHARLQQLELPAPPFADPPKERGAHWARPELVAEVEFTEWTRDGRLRHPSFLGLRDDKAAGSVGRETPEQPV